MGDLLVGLLIAPLSASVVALFGKLVPAKRLTIVVASLSIPANGVLLALLLPTIREGSVLTYAMGGWPAPLGIEIQLNGLGWIASALIVVISVAVILVSTARHGDDPAYFFFLFLLIAGMQAVVVTTDLFNMFVSFEIVAIAAYVLIAYEKSTTSLVASVKYLILSTVGILFFLVGVLLVYRDIGSLAFGDVSRAIAEDPTVGESGSMHLAIAALCVGIGVRTAFIPFHTWLPEAHAYAPHPISAMLSGVLIKVSFLAMVRVLAAFRADYLNELLLWIGAVTAFVAVIWALSQSDAKRLLAYHSISQMGYILAAFGIGGFSGELAAVSHAVNHALFKSLLFVTVGTAVDLGGSRNLYKLGGLGRRAPLLAVTFLVGALSIAGMPPFNGYASKQLVSAALSGRAAYVLIWITGVGTVASFIKLSRIFSFRRDGVDGGENAESMRSPSGRSKGSPVSTGFAVVFLASLCVFTGVFPELVGGFLGSILHHRAATPALPTFFSSGKLLQTALVLGLGVGTFFAATSKPAGLVTGRIKTLAPDIETVLVFFFAGLTLFALVSYL